MVSIGRFAVSFLLASSNTARRSGSSSGKRRLRISNNHGTTSRSPKHQQQKSQEIRTIGTVPAKGRNRYGSHGIKDREQRDSKETRQQEPLPPPPDPTAPNGPYPTYYTCRHTYEETLIEEISRHVKSKCSKIYPGLVRVEDSTNLWLADNNSYFEPVYALQALPNCRIVKSPNSIKGLARVCIEQDYISKLSTASRGSLSIHALVPGMCKGQKDPMLQRRSYLVGEAISEALKKQYAAARKLPQQSNNNHMDDLNEPSQKWLLQVLLLSADVAAVSLSESMTLPSHIHHQAISSWPNIKYPLGMAKVDITEYKMPSSAYRKLLEAFSFLGYMPSPDDTVVDLGASPGGWTAAVLLLCPCQQIIAVDRSNLDPSLMRESRVQFVQGDAFTYRPPSGTTVQWMISDIIAYPERVIELLHMWCGERLASNMIVTVKFQGVKPSWEALDLAMEVGKSYGYSVHAKHFFNNKNEVTLLLRGNQDNNSHVQQRKVGEWSLDPFYSRVWPKQSTLR